MKLDNTSLYVNRRRVVAILALAAAALSALVFSPAFGQALAKAESPGLASDAFKSRTVVRGAKKIPRKAARNVAGLAIMKWFGNGYLTPDSPMSEHRQALANATRSARCRGPRRASRFKCRFRYMPGNTVYRGKIVVRVTKVGRSTFRARADGKGTILRLPPPKPFRRSSKFTMVRTF